MNMKRFIGALLTIAIALCQSHAQGNFWTQTNGPGTNYDVRSFAVNSQGVLFAGTWTDGAVWRTTDNGAEWTKCAPFPQQNPVLGLAVNSHDLLFASVYLRGVFRSSDNGISWQAINEGLNDFGVRKMLVDDTGYVWVCSENGLYRSTNDGNAWTNVLSGSFSHVEQDSSKAIVAQYQYLWKSTNHGNSWEALPDSNIEIDNIHPDGSYFGSREDGGIYRSTNQGGFWTRQTAPAAFSGYTWWIASNPQGDLFYARDGDAAGIMVSRDTGKTWTVQNSGLTKTRVIPLICHPNGYVFAGTNGAGVFRSTYKRGMPTGRAINVKPLALNFGGVIVGASDTLQLVIENIGSEDTLRVDSVVSTNPVFAVPFEGSGIPPLGSRAVTIIYTPDTTRRDSGALRIVSNDPTTPHVVVSVSGRGYILGHEPLILSIALINGYSTKARIQWIRSLDDSVGAADQAVQYGIWQLVKDPGSAKRIVPPASFSSIPAAWEFIQAVPAMGLQVYSAVVTLTLNYTTGDPWNTFMIAVLTRSGQVYQSAPDSVDPVITGPATGVDRPVAPKEFYLRQNYPNPFNPSTVIEYGLSTKQQVFLTVHNVLGQQVATLVDAVQEPGTHTVRFDATGLPSGVYFYRLKTADFVQTRRLVLLH